VTHVLLVVSVLGDRLYLDEVRVRFRVCIVNEICLLPCMLWRAILCFPRFTNGVFMMANNVERVVKLSDSDISLLELAIGLKLASVKRARNSADPAFKELYDKVDRDYNALLLRIKVHS